MPYTYVERYRIHRKAKKILGIKQGAGDKFIFMEQCMSTMMDEGSVDDEDNARDICELLYDEMDDTFGE